MCWHPAPYLQGDIICLYQHVLYLNPIGWSSFSCNLQSLPTYASGSFVKLIEWTWKHIQYISPWKAALDSHWDPQNWREEEPIQYLMFTDLSLQGIVVKPGFSKWHFPPHLPPVQPFKIFMRGRIIRPSLVSVVNVWMTCYSQLPRTGLNAQLFLESWITFLPWLPSAGRIKPLHIEERNW